MLVFAFQVVLITVIQFRIAFRFGACADTERGLSVLLTGNEKQT